MTTVSLKNHHGFTDAELAFAKASLQELEATVSDPRFLLTVARHTFCPEPRRPLARFERPSGAQIADIIATGEELEQAPTGSLDLSLRLRELADTVYGAARPGAPWISLNRAAFRRWMKANTPRYAAAIIMHEWMHLAGFLHDSEDLNQTSEDVAYGIERLVLYHGTGGVAPLDALSPEARLTYVAEWACPAVLPSQRPMRR